MSRVSVNWPFLGAVRFALAIVVLGFHLYDFRPEAGVAAWLKEFHGSSAVYGFLMISGFSIAHSITKQREGYLKRRLIRVFPLYIVVLSLSLVAFFAWGRNHTLPVQGAFSVPTNFEIITSFF